MHSLRHREPPRVRRVENLAGNDNMGVFQELEEEGIPALRARLAERLDLSAPSVSEGVARLEADGLVRLEEDRTVSLTADGRDIATHVMRKHRLAERLLIDVLGVGQLLVQAVEHTPDL